MYSSTHSSVGISILLLPIPLFITIPLAIISHAFVDMIGEGYIKDWVYYESFLHVLLLIFGLLTGTIWFVIGGIILGNLIDIVDKLIFKPKFGKEFIHSNKRYPAVKWTLSSQDTFAFNILATILTCGFLGV